AVYGGKTGGALRLYALALYLGSDWDVNDMGYFAKKDGNQVVNGNVHLVYAHPRPFGPFNQTSVDLSYNAQWDPNAGNPMEPTPLVDSRIVLDTILLGRRNWRAGVTAAHAFARFDDAETRQNPQVRLYRRPYADSIIAYVRSDDSRRVWVQLANALDAEN